MFSADAITPNLENEVGEIGDAKLLKKKNFDGDPEVLLLIATLSIAGIKSLTKIMTQIIKSKKPITIKTSKYEIKVNTIDELQSALSEIKKHIKK
jgi:hypothetical protein